VGINAGDVAPAVGADAASAQAEADATSFASWIRPHWVLLHRLAVCLCGATDGDDVLQDALAAAWRKRHQFDPERGSAQAWLLAIVADQGRKQWTRSRARRISRAARETGAAETSLDGAAALDLMLAVRQLSARQRLAVSLYYYLDLPVAEVAVAMSCSPGTVKSTLSDARHRLQELLGDAYR
jgi:RNA polymerase sigma-70 factor (ECF subfamily)